MHTHDTVTSQECMSHYTHLLAHFWQVELSRLSIPLLSVLKFIFVFCSIIPLSHGLLNTTINKSNSKLFQWKINKRKEINSAQQTVIQQQRPESPKVTPPSIWVNTGYRKPKVHPQKKMSSSGLYIPSISGTLGNTGVYRHTTEPIFIQDQVGFSAEFLDFVVLSVWRYLGWKWSKGILYILDWLTTCGSHWPYLHHHIHLHGSNIQETQPL